MPDAETFTYQCTSVSEMPCEDPRWQSVRGPVLAVVGLVVWAVWDGDDSVVRHATRETGSRDSGLECGTAVSNASGACG